MMKASEHEDRRFWCRRKGNKKMMNTVSRFFRDEEGQDIIEYALLAAFISIIAVVTVKLIGPLVDVLLVEVQKALTP